MYVCMYVCMHWTHVQNIDLLCVHVYIYIYIYIYILYRLIDR